MRYRLPTLVCVAVGLLSPLAAPVSGDTAKAGRPPNIVMIISDDQAYGDYGFMGHPHIQTPNIDKLASQSLTFKRGYVPASLCCPSLATIITGLYPHQHKVTSGLASLHPLRRMIAHHAGGRVADPSTN